VWHAYKWWREVKDAGTADLRNPFVKALYTSLRVRGIIHEDGRPRKELERPEMLRGLYAREWVEMHQRFDELGAVKIATNQVDRNALELFYSDIHLQGWHKIMVRAFLKAMGFSDGLSVLEPLSGEGYLAAVVYNEYTPAFYLGFHPNPSLVEIAKKMVKNAQFVVANSNCEVRGSYDAVLLLEKLHLFTDPAAELKCIREVLKPGGKVYVAQPVVESMPGYLAIHAAAAVSHISVFTWKEVEQLLEMAFVLHRRLIKAMPFYGAVWRRG
jgi:SAM-dependent methyltransferase